MRHGCFWRLFDSEKLIGMAVVRSIDEVNRIAELKRLYLLPEYQGNGGLCSTVGYLPIKSGNLLRQPAHGYRRQHAICVAPKSILLKRYQPDF